MSTNLDRIIAEAQTGWDLLPTWQTQRLNTQNFRHKLQLNIVAHIANTYIQPRYFPGMERLK